MKLPYSIKHTVAAFGLAIFILAAAAPLIPAAEGPDRALPDFIVRELAHLEETYRILDITAAKVWPGWTNYRDFPFCLQYPDNLRILIGHPNPPEPFVKLPRYKVEDKDVFADFSAVSTAKVEYPLMAGGGPQPLGTDRDGKPVIAVMLSYMSPDILKKGGVGVIHMPFCAELQILCNIHELFHCFQPGHIRMDVVGSITFNPDASYALYSTLEGRALLNAFRADSRENADAFIGDFLAARMLKRKLSMPEMQGKQESGDELLEGTAVYSTIRILEILSEGYETKIDLTVDPYYTGFKNAPAILEACEKELKDAAEQIFETDNKCYHYGCFQALYLQKYHPGWQEVFTRNPSTLDRELAARIPFDGKDIAPQKKRFREIYGFDLIKARSDEIIGRRDAAYHELKARRGTSYIISFKEIAQYETQLAAEADSFRLGYINMYMNGLPAVRFDKTEISPISVPVEGNSFYYFKIVDTAPKAGAEPFSVEGKTADGSVYENAVITTPLFTLKTPLVRIEESNRRVKFIILPVLRK